MKKIALIATLFAFSLLANLASAQQADFMLGFGTLMAPSSSSSSTCVISLNSGCIGVEKGGLYPTISGDVIFHRRIGINMEATWRGKQGLTNDGSQLYRPIQFDFNGVFQPRLGKKLGADLIAGIGWQDTRFYQYTYTINCLDFGACYVGDNHFLMDFGGGLRYYFWKHVFIRPEVRFYHILNNTDVFSNTNVIRVGASLGFTIGPD